MYFIVFAALNWKLKYTFSDEIFIFRDPTVDNERLEPSWKEFVDYLIDTPFHQVYV